MHCSSTWPCVKVREIDTGMSPTNLFQKFGQQNESTHQRNITWKITVAFSQNSRLTWLHRRTLIISHVIPAMMCQTAEPATERRLRGHREGFCYSQSWVEKSHLLITYQPSFISYIQFHGPKKKKHGSLQHVAQLTHVVHILLRKPCQPMDPPMVYFICGSWKHF
jgi:hypothetical protein